MQLAIKERYYHQNNDQYESNIYVFNSAMDCSIFLGKPKGYVTKNARKYYIENHTLKGLKLISNEEKAYSIIAYVSPSIQYHQNFNFWNSEYSVYGNCVIIKNIVTNKNYGFNSTYACCKFLGRTLGYFNNLEGKKIKIIKSRLTKDQYQILQFKINGKTSSVSQTRKECERFGSQLKMHKKDNHKQIALLLNKIDQKYDNLVDACMDQCPEFIELQRLENSYEFNFFEW